MTRAAADLLVAAASLWNVASRDTGQSRVCARLLLGLYNGHRFPFDLTDLRLLDAELLRAAIDLMAADATHTLRCEVHELLNKGTGRTDFGHRFEHLAHEWTLPGRCLVRHLAKLEPKHLVLQLPAAQLAPSAEQALHPMHMPDVAARPWASTT